MRHVGASSHLAAYGRMLEQSATVAAAVQNFPAAGTRH
jgi:hypothetical protein